MFRTTIGAASLTAAGVFALALGGSAAAAPSGSAELGQHVATCAQEHLGQRGSPPALTCSCDGVTMDFANFGAMVQHMRAMHGE